VAFFHLSSPSAATVNPIDWKMRSGARQEESPLSVPAILGRDVSGVVRAIGANVKPFKPGESVIALCNSTYAELVAVNNSDVTHLPDNVDLADAAAIPLIVLTGDNSSALRQTCKKGQAALITGALGGVRARGSDAYGEKDRCAGDCGSFRERTGRRPLPRCLWSASD
jgi:NADPH:quinone reductase-like Zn-dependent oxidoreductase